MRVGHGYDVHRLVPNRKLVLGGVSIDYELGLDGHSDADVLLHALCDAILGALGQGDIGQHFPDTDAAFENIDSRLLLGQVAELMRSSDYKICNVDATVVAEAPKLAPHLAQMCQNISQDLGCSVQRVNIKATTTETMGFAGRGEGIAAHAVVLLENNGQR